MDMEPSDEALVLACRTGDATAWESLVERYQWLVYSIARHAGLDHDQAADVFQRVFVQLVAHLGQIEQPALIGAWLATTARHEAWRFSRREHMARVASLDAPEAVEPFVDKALLPEALMLRLEEQHQVRIAVAALDERCRRLLILLFYRTDTAPYAEIAATLGMSEGSIGPTRARCLQKLRRLLNDLNA
jgi:RNA polymerase sigma factor (sigma-70 family)